MCVVCTYAEAVVEVTLHFLINEAVKFGVNSEDRLGFKSCSSNCYWASCLQSRPRNPSLVFTSFRGQPIGGLLSRRCRLMHPPVLSKAAVSLLSFISIPMSFTPLMEKYSRRHTISSYFSTQFTAYICCQPLSLCTIILA